MTTAERARVDAMFARLKELTGISEADVLGPNRAGPLSKARAVIAVVLRRIGLSWRDIARTMGRRDHTTAMSAFYRGRRLVADYPDLKGLALSLSKSMEPKDATQV